jgi:serine/threonine-protein kinase HipA
MKLSVRINPETGTVETVSEGGTHILKPEPGTFPELPHNENLCMNMAATVGLTVPPHGLFPMADGTFCYIVKRFDRLDSGGKLQKETLFQISGQENKYAGSLESLGKIIHRYTTRTGLDALYFFERVLLCFIIGNGDMHQKNWALLTDPQGVVKLAPCYDFVSSKVYLPNESDSALTVNGKHHGLTRKDFEVLATTLRIDPKAAQFALNTMSSHREHFMTLAKTSTLSPPLHEKFISLFQERHQRLFRTSTEG